MNLVRGTETNGPFIVFIQKYAFGEDLPDLVNWLQEECDNEEVSLYELEFKLRSIYKKR